MNLSVIIPNRNDTVMLAVTVRSALEELKEVGGEIIVADNSDEDIWNILKTPNDSPLPLAYMSEEKLKLIHIKTPSIYTARARGIREAKGKYSVNIDSHTIIGHNTFKDLVVFMDSSSDKVGFGYAPIGWLSQHGDYARHDIRIDKGLYGNWGRQYMKPTKICWDFGWRICRTKWFNEEFGAYGFYDSKHISWGGGELYIPMKAWLLGYENWAVPTSPLYHIGPFSKRLESRTSYRYRQYGSSGNGTLGIGVLAAFYALGGEDMKEEAKKCEPALQHNFGITVENNWSEARKLARKEWEWIKEHQTISYFDLMKKQPWAEDGWGNWDEWDKQVAKTIDMTKVYED